MYGLTIPALPHAPSDPEATYLPDVTCDAIYDLHLQWGFSSDFRPAGGIATSPGPGSDQRNHLGLASSPLLLGSI